MDKANMSTITLGENRYAIDLLNPLDAISFGNRCIATFSSALGETFKDIEFKAIGDINLLSMDLVNVAEHFQPVIAAMLSSLAKVNTPEATALMTESIAHCYTPENESLSDTATFNRWFRAHPQELYPLGGMALFTLVKDFFPLPFFTQENGTQQILKHLRENTI